METIVGSLPTHKFNHHTTGSEDYVVLPQMSAIDRFKYLLELYVNNFISLIVPTAQQQLDHCAMATMMGTRDAFLADN